MNHVRVALTTLVLLAFASPLARAGESARSDPAAKAFLHEIYDRYPGKNSKGMPLSSNADINRYFAPELAGPIIADRTIAQKVGDIPTLEGDPFVNAQEWAVDKLDISVQQQGKEKAIGTVKFINRGKPQTVIVELVKMPNGWRIHDITARGEKLSALFIKK
jgi:hypothetical protein